TQGNWAGIYGAQGYDVAAGSAALPTYAAITTAGAATATWASITADPRALQQPGHAGRSATYWYSPTSFTVNVSLADGQVHELSLYAVDWDNQGRSEQIQLINTATGAVIDSEVISSFSGGEYLRWAVSGNVSIKVTDLAGPNSVVSGLFLDAA